MMLRFILTGCLWTLSIYLIADNDKVDAAIVAMWGVINLWHTIEENRRTER